MTAAGVMLLADRGKLALSDPVHKFITEFAGSDRELVTVQHLLTHTSGLPDMLPENVELRKRHAPLADFVAGAGREAVVGPSGTQGRCLSGGGVLAAGNGRRILQEVLWQVLARGTVLSPGEGCALPRSA